MSLAVMVYFHARLFLIFKGIFLSYYVIWVEFHDVTYFKGMICFVLEVMRELNYFKYN